MVSDDVQCCSQDSSVRDQDQDFKNPYGPKLRPKLEVPDQSQDSKISSMRGKLYIGFL